MRRRWAKWPTLGQPILAQLARPGGLSWLVDDRRTPDLCGGWGTWILWSQEVATEPDAGSIPAASTTNVADSGAFSGLRIGCDSGPTRLRDLAPPRSRYSTSAALGRSPR